MAYGWEGERVRLVPLDKARHLENLHAWMNDPDVTETILSGNVPLARVTQEEFIDKVSATPGRPPSDVVFAVEPLGGEHIGICGLHQIDYRHGVAHSGTIIGPAEARGKGYGSEVARPRTRYAFEVLGLRMLTQAGYREVARFPRRYWKRGAFRLHPSSFRAQHSSFDGNKNRAGGVN